MKRIIILILSFSFVIIALQAQDPLEAARKKIQANDFSGAKAELTKILDANAKNKQALNLRGTARMGLEDYYGAIGDFNSALEIDSTFAEALNNRGESKMALGDDE